MHNGNNFRFNDSTESCRLGIRTVFMRLFYLSLSKGKKSFPVTSITLELVSCPTRFPSCRRNSLLKSNPRYYFFQRLVFNLYYPNNIQRYEIFFFPSNNFSKFFSKSFFPPLPPVFDPRVIGGSL